MKTYPEVIDLSKYAAHSDADIQRDIAETEAEIRAEKAMLDGERAMLATNSLPDHQRRMTEFRSSARPDAIKERENFVAFLKRIQEARRAAETADAAQAR